jgi:hypothetical protein
MEERKEFREHLFSKEEAKKESMEIRFKNETCR